MLRSLLTFIGRPKDVTFDDFEKIREFLSDNADVILVWQNNRFILFSPTTVLKVRKATWPLKVRKATWPRLRDFEMFFGIENFAIESETDTFYHLRLSGNKTGLLDQIAVITSAFLTLSNEQPGQEDEQLFASQEQEEPVAVKEEPKQEPKAQPVVEARREKRSRKPKEKSAVEKQETKQVSKDDAKPVESQPERKKKEKANKQQPEAIAAKQGKSVPTSDDNAKAIKPKHKAPDKQPESKPVDNKVEKKQPDKTKQAEKQETTKNNSVRKRKREMVA